MDTVNKLLDRATYRLLKNYSKDEMAGFCNRVYMSGRNAAFEELDREKIKADISAIKGIGEVKLAEIMAIFDRELEKAAANNGSDSPKTKV